jgi:hypothetical protein
MCGYGKDFGNLLENNRFFGIELMLVRPQHPECRIEEKDAENINDPVDLVDQGNPEKDHQGPENNSAQDSPKEDPVLIDGRDGKCRENHRDHKDIVNTQGKLDQIPGDILQDSRARGQVSRVLHEIGAEEPVNYPAKAQGHRDPDSRPGGSLFGADNVVVLMENTEIKSQEDNDYSNKDDPDPHGWPCILGKDKNRNGSKKEPKAPFITLSSISL